MAEIKYVGEEALAELVEQLKGYVQGYTEALLTSDAYNDLLDSMLMRTITEISDEDGSCTGVGAYALYQCTSLATVDLPAATSVGTYALYGCTALTSASLPAATSLGASAMQGCTALESVDLTACTSLGQYALYGLTSLTSLDLPVLGSIPNYTIRNCTSLATVNLGACTSIGSYALAGCTALASLTLSASTVCTLNTNGIDDTAIADGEGYIYVPADLVDSYKSASSWSTYADQIVAIEE